MTLLALAAMAVTLGAGRSATLPRTVSVEDSCAPLSQPKLLPSLDVVLDSTALLNRLAALDTTSRGELVVSVLYFSRPSGEIIERSVPVPAGEQVLGHVLSSLRPASKNAPLAFRLRVRLGGASVPVLERSILCVPRNIETGGREVRVAFGPAESREGGSRPPRAPRSITPRIRISASGQVVEVNLGSGTGIPELDRSIREHTLGQRYHPALLDGRPVEVWVSGKKVELIP